MRATSWLKVGGSARAAAAAPTTAIASVIARMLRMSPSRLARGDADPPQPIGVEGKLHRARRETIDAQDVRDHVGVLLRRQLARLLGRRRHRLTNLVEEIRERLVVPVRLELRTGQRRRALAAFEALAVAGRAFPRVDRLTALLLCSGVHAVRRRPAVLRIRGQREYRRNDPIHQATPIRARSRSAALQRCLRRASRPEGLRYRHSPRSTTDVRLIRGGLASMN